MSQQNKTSKSTNLYLILIFKLTRTFVAILSALELVFARFFWPTQCMNIMRKQFEVGRTFDFFLFSLLHESS